MKKKLEQLSTPAILVEKHILFNNIKTMQVKASSFGANLRPHIKTHKSFFIAALQMKQGAVGITASKVSEALPFIQAGFPSVTIAYPLVESKKINQLIKTAKRFQCQLTLIVDSSFTLKKIEEATHVLKYSVDIRMKIDVGLHRCGFQKEDPQLFKLIKKIRKNDCLTLKGLLSHAGQSYASGNKKEVQQIAETEYQILQSVNKKLIQQKEKSLNFSIGSTPTVLASPSFEKPINELRPGNYVFLDRTPLRLKLAKRTDLSLSVLATVISKNDRYFILNVGSKTLSSDAGAHGNKNMQGYGLVYPLSNFPRVASELIIEKLSEEHAFVHTNQKVNLSIGDKVRILPNHSCVVMNLAKHWYLVDGERVIRKERKNAP